MPKTVTRQRRDCDLNPGPSAPESSTLTSATEPPWIEVSITTPRCLSVCVSQLYSYAAVRWSFLVSIYTPTDSLPSISTCWWLARGKHWTGVESALYLDLLQSVPVSGPLVITGHLAKVLVVMVTRYTRCHGNGRSNAQLPRLLWRLRRQRLLPMPREHRW